MKIITRIFALLGIVSLSSFAQVSSPVSRLETEYRRTRAETLQQLNLRYIASLEALKRNQMVQNDLAGANASQALIDELKAENSALIAGQSAGLKESGFGRTIPTVPTELFLDNGRHKVKEVAFKLEQGLIRKARLVVTFTQKTPGRKTSTAGSIFIFRPGSPLKKVGEWSSKDSKNGKFDCDLLEHLAEPGEYRLRFTTNADGAETLEPKVRID